MQACAPQIQALGALLQQALTIAITLVAGFVRHGDAEAWERIDSLHSNSAIWPLGKRTKSLGPAVLQCLWGREYIRYTTYHKDRKAHGVSFRPAVVTLYVSRQYFPCWGYGNFRRPSYVLITSSLRKLWSWFT